MEYFAQRLDRLIEELGVNAAKFADMVGESRAAISKYRSMENGYKPGFDSVYKILKSLPNLNGRWLIVGEGEIWMTDYDSQFQNQLVIYEQKIAELENSKKLVDTQEKLIRFLESEITSLKNKS